MATIAIMNARKSLQEKDGGRTRRGLLVVAACGLVWAALVWLILYLL